MVLKRLTRPFATFVLAAALLAGASPAGAVTLHDVMALSQAGLSDAVLIALIQADETIYGVSPDQLVLLKKAGVSEPVILALLRNGRTRADASPETPPPATATTDAARPSTDNGVTIVGDHSSPAGESGARAEVVQSVVVVPTPVFYPIVVGAGRGGPHRLHHARQPVAPAPAYQGFGRFINNGFVAAPSSILNGSVNVVNGIRIVTPRVVTAKVGGQR